MVDQARNQAEVISDLFQELGYRTEIRQNYIPWRGWGVTIKTTNHSPQPHEGEHPERSVALIAINERGNLAVEWDEPKNFARKILDAHGLERFVTQSLKAKVGAWEISIGDTRGGNPMAYVNGPKWSDSGLLGHDGFMRWDFPERIPDRVKDRAYRMVIAERLARGLKKFPA